MRKHRLAPHLASLALFTVVAVAWATFLLGKGGGLPRLGGSTYAVEALIPSGAALAPGSRVTVAGVDVGRVKEVQRRGIGARIRMEIADKDVLPLAADSRVQIRQHTPVGENYVAISAGRSAQKLPSGGVLPVTQADEFVDVDRLLSVLKGPTRARARQTIQGLGFALRGRGEQLNEVVGQTARFLPAAGTFVRTAYQDREHAARLVDQLGDVAAAIGQRDDAITQIADRGLVALDAIRDRDASLRQTIALLPQSLRRVRSTADRVRAVTAVAQPVVQDATATLRALRPVVGELGPAATQGRRVMHELRGAEPGLQGILDALGPLSQTLPGTLGKAHKAICQAAPMLRYSKPYFPEALHILTGLGSVSNSYDATGHLLRLAPIFGENSVSGLPASVSQASQQLMYAGLVSDTVHNKIDYDAFMKPGSLGHTVATSNTPLGPAGMKAAGYTYPHVTADC